MNIGLKPIMAILVAVIMVGVVAVPIINDVNVTTHEVEVEKTGIYKTNMEGSYEWYETYTGTRNYATNPTASTDYNVDVTKTATYATNQTDSITYEETSGIGYQVKYIVDGQLTDDTSGTLVYVFDKEYLEQYPIFGNLYTFKYNKWQKIGTSSASVSWTYDELNRIGDYELKFMSCPYPNYPSIGVQFTTVNEGAQAVVQPSTYVGSAIPITISVDSTEFFISCCSDQYIQVSESGKKLEIQFGKTYVEASKEYATTTTSGIMIAYSAENDRWEYGGNPISDGEKSGSITYTDSEGSSKTVSITNSWSVGPVFKVEGSLPQTSFSSTTPSLYLPMDEVSVDSTYIEVLDGTTTLRYTGSTTTGTANITYMGVSGTYRVLNADLESNQTLLQPMTCWTNTSNGEMVVYKVHYNMIINGLEYQTPTTTQITVSSEYGTMSGTEFTADASGDYLKIPSKLLSGKTYNVGEDTYYLYNGTSVESNVCPTVSSSWTTGYIPTFTAVTDLPERHTTDVYTMAVDSPASDLYIIIPKDAGYDYLETETRTAVSEYGTMSGVTFTADASGDYLKIPSQLLDKTYYVAGGSLYYTWFNTSSAPTSANCPLGISGTGYDFQFTEAQAKDYATTKVYSMSVTDSQDAISYVIIPKDATYSYSETVTRSVSSEYGNIVDGQFVADDNGTMLKVPKQLMTETYYITDGAAYYIADTASGNLETGTAPSTNGFSADVPLPTFTINAENDQIYDVVWTGELADGEYSVIPKNATYTYMGTETVTEEGSPLIGIVPVLLIVGVICATVAVWFGRDAL